jgi:CheY-like chemotaxis protein
MITDNDGPRLRQAMEASPSPSFIVQAGGLLIVQANADWDVIAAEAGGPSRRQIVGTWWPGCIADLELRTWYQDLFERVLVGRRSERALCECNTPDRFRLLALQFDPLAGPEGEPSDVRITASRLVDAPIEQHYGVVSEPGGARHRDRSGLTVQCSCCRRVHVAGTSPRRWEFVAGYLIHPPPAVSHGLCQRCREAYYSPRGDRPAVGAAGVAGAAAAPSPGCQVLVVDDDEDLREVLTGLLEAEGYRTQQAGSAAEATAILAGATEPPRLILLDVFMPGTSGLELLRTLRLRPELDGVKVVMLTGWCGAIDPGVGLGAVTWLRKPVTAEVMLGMVERMVHGVAA